jgi:hypothetical protein
MRTARTIPTMIAILRVVTHALLTKDGEQFFRVHPKEAGTAIGRGPLSRSRDAARAQLAHDHAPDVQSAPRGGFGYVRTSQEKPLRERDGGTVAAGQGSSDPDDRAEATSALRVAGSPLWARMVRLPTASDAQVSGSALNKLANR